MKYFTMTELTKSATAQRLGINNTPGLDEQLQLHKLVDNILDPLREAYGKPIIVTSAFRCEKLNKAVGGSSTSQHCLDEQTEVLTISGWKRYDTISNDDELLTYNVKSDKIEVVPIDEIIMRQHNGRMLKIESTCLDVMVTDKHRMLVRYNTHKYVRKSNHTITPSGQAYFDSLKTENYKYHFELAEELFKKRRLFKCASVYDGEQSGNLDLLMFAMAFVCDGYWCHKQSNISMGFRFKRQRKIAYLQELSNNLGWQYSMHVDKYGVTNFHFRQKYAQMIYDIVGDKKLLPHSLILLSAQDKKALVECYNSFDGHTDERDGRGRMSISTVVKNNADVLQAMVVTSGQKCAMQVKKGGIYNIKGKVGKSKPCYTISICDRDETKVSEDGYKWVNYNGIVWCVNNRNTTLITRRNGKVCFMGNCLGQAADIRCVSDTPSGNKELFDLIRELKLPFDQLIWEYGNLKTGPNWVHVSYSPRNRRQVLQAIRNGKKTTYKTMK